MALEVFGGEVGEGAGLALFDLARSGVAAHGGPSERRPRHLPSLAQGEWWAGAEGVAAQASSAPVEYAEGFAAGGGDADGEPREEVIKVLRPLPANRPQRLQRMCRELRSRHLLIETRKWARSLPLAPENPDPRPCGAGEGFDIGAETRVNNSETQDNSARTNRARRFASI